MPGFADSLDDRFTAHSVDLVRVEASLQRRVINTLEKLNTELVGDLARIDPNAPPQVKYKEARLKTLLKQTRATINKWRDSTSADFRSQMIELAELETSWASTAMNAVFGGTVVSVAITRSLLTKIADSTLILGAPSKDWWARQAGDLQTRFANEVRNGMLRGEGMDDMTRRIRGRYLGGGRYEGGIMAAPRYQVRALVRSSVQAVANSSRLAVYDENLDVIKSYQARVTLDGRTSDICIARGSPPHVWDAKTKEPLNSDDPWPGPPPWHWQCRSTLLPITYSWEELQSESAPVGQDQPFDLGASPTAQAQRQLVNAPNLIVPLKDQWREAAERANQLRRREHLRPYAYNLEVVPAKAIKPSQFGEDYLNSRSRDLATKIKKFDLDRSRDFDLEALRPIVLDDAGVIIDGNHRHAAAMINGDKHLIVLRPAGYLRKNVVRNGDEFLSTFRQRPGNLRTTMSYQNVPRKLSEVPLSTQASMDGQIAADITYEQWLKGKPEEFQRKVLGSTKYRLWKEGKLNLGQLIDQSGHPRSVAEIKAELGLTAPTPQYTPTLSGVMAQLDKIDTAYAESAAVIRERLGGVLDEAEQVFTSLTETGVKARDAARARIQALRDQGADRIWADSLFNELQAEVTKARNDFEKLTEAITNRFHNVLLVPDPIKLDAVFARAGGRALSATSKNVIAGFGHVKRFTSKKLAQSLRFKVNSIGSGERAYEIRNTINVTWSEPAEIIAHEIGHVIEEQVPGVHERVKAFLAKRAKADPDGLRPLNSITNSHRYDAREKAWADKFIDPYMGKHYTDGTEVLSMGIELLAKNPYKLYTQDPEYFDLIVDLLRGLV